MTTLVKGCKHSPVDSKKAFSIHLLVFLVTTPIIWFVWWQFDKGYPWPLWQTPAWAIGLLFHYLGVYVFKKNRRR